MSNISLITTVFNERANVDAWFASIVAQVRQPDELVIVDAGSTDGTLEALERLSKDVRFPVKIFVHEGCTRSEGRNIAIHQASFDLIAATDAGCHLNANWLGTLEEGFFGSDVDIVSGWYRPWLETWFDKLVGVVMIPALSEINPEDFLPSSRSVAFRRSAWSKVGGYPNDLNFAEDTLFDLNLRASGARFLFAPKAFVLWRPVSSFKRMFKAGRNYGFGDGLARIVFWHRNRLLRYGGLLIGLGISLWYQTPLLLLAMAFGILVFLIRRLDAFRNRAAEFSRESGGDVSLKPGDLALAVGCYALLDLAILIGLLEGLLSKRQLSRKAS